MSKTIFSLFKRLAKVILVCVIIIGGFLFGEIFQTRAASSDIVINEIMANALDEDTGEFVELYNKSSQSIDVLGWGLFDAIDTNDHLIDYTGANNWGKAGTTIPAYGYALIVDPEYAGEYNAYLSSHADSNKVVMLTIDQDTTIGNGLTNSGDTITIDDGAGYTASYTWSSDAGNGISWEKIDPQGGDQQSNWKICTDSFGSTPGSQNSPPNQPPVIEITSANPSSIPADGRSTTLLSAKVSDPDGLGDIDSVTIDLSALGGSETQAMYDDATNGDTTASDGTFSYSTFVSVATKAGSYSLSITVIDSIGSEASKTLALAVTQPVYSDKIIVNEFLANPEGTDSEGEWIELYNKGNSTVDLSGWQLDDADGGSSPYTLPDETSIEAGQYLVFYRTDTGIALNNDGDQVRLLQPDENVTSSANYADYAEEGVAYALTSEGEWTWTTTPTPGEQNLITSPGDEEEEKEGEEKGEAGESGDNPKELSISDVREEEKGVWVKTKGIITCPPGIFSGSTIFYIQDEKAGIRIYSSSEDVGELKLGDEAEVIGKVSERSGEKKINIKGEEDITVASHKDPLQAKHVKTGEIGEDYEGLLVIISGKIVETHGSVFYVDDGSGKIKIYIKKSTGIDKPEMHKGDVVTITGIVSEAYDAYRILPRFQDDVKLGKVLGAASEDKLAKTGTSFWLVIVITCLIMGLGCLLRFGIRLKKIA